MVFDYCRGTGREGLCSGKAVGPEAFWHTRQRFAASLAATSAAAYLLGIGDSQRVPERPNWGLLRNLCICICRLQQ